MTAIFPIWQSAIFCELMSTLATHSDIDTKHRRPWCSGNTSASQAEYAGSNPAGRSKETPLARLAVVQGAKENRTSEGTSRAREE